MPRYEPWSAERTSVIIATHKHRDGAALPIFHAIQHVFGFVPDEAIPMVAEALNLSRAEMYGTVTFYHGFRKELPGRRVLKLCRAESCQAAGGDALAARAERAGAKMLQRPADQFWGDRYGVLQYPFGHQWSMGQPVREVSMEESKRR